jgi:prevent-host-death family protein
MITVGVRELKDNLSGMLQRVRLDRETIDITHRGQTIARLVPVEPPPPAPDEIEALMADLATLAAEIGRQWPAGVSAVEAVAEGRRG